jgi:RNA polymerase sigma-70 factor, ECF subfamily
MFASAAFGRNLSVHARKDVTVDANVAVSEKLVESFIKESDGQVVKEARASPDAFAVIYFRYRDRVYGYLRARTATEEDASDLTQQVFSRVFTSLHQFRPRRGTFPSWIFGIARNASIDFHRRCRSHADLGGMAEIGSMGSVEAEVLRTEEIDALRAAIMTLPAEKQEILVLRYTAQLSLPEIGRVVGKRPDAVRMSIVRTLQQLKELLNETE